jgi:hypothetical protein
MDNSAPTASGCGSLLDTQRPAHSWHCIVVRSLTLLFKSTQFIVCSCEQTSNGSSVLDSIDYLRLGIAPSLGCASP